MPLPQSAPLVTENGSVLHYSHTLITVAPEVSLNMYLCRTNISERRLLTVMYVTLNHVREAAA